MEYLHLLEWCGSWHDMVGSLVLAYFKENVNCFGII